MPTEQHDQDRDHDRDRDRDTDRGDRKSKTSSAASKTKDLSHVPCKFFKVGGCTAGASCPFSHSSSAEPGQKETCTWFVKGNCKFGHKCALAHILPGQSPAMDRKNKKAAQAAAASGGDKAKTASGSGRPKREAASGSPASARLPLLAGGASAPTRGGTGSRPPMGVPLKASISPSAPAPPLKDTDFAAFATLDEMEKQASEEAETSTSNPLPPSEPRPSATPSAPKDFGPIGSPPNYRPSQPTSPIRTSNGTFSPGTSPRNNTHINGVNININSSASPAPQGTPSAALLSSSPFSAPGTQSAFISGSYTTGGGFGNMGMAASLGSGLAMMGGRKGWADQTDAAPSSFSGLQRDYDINIEYDDFGGSGVRRRTRDVVVEDEEMEDFIPSSLTELLTPEERSRRMSRSHSGQGGISQLSRELAAGADAGSAALPAATTANGSSGIGHRYSRSVPAPTLLGDIKSIWADPTTALPASPNSRAAAGYASSRFDPYGGASAGGTFADTDGLSMSIGSAGAAGSSFGMMSRSPSNASAAFLPGLHHHYLSAKAKQQQAQAQLGLGGIGRQLRGASGPGVFQGTGATGTTGGTGIGGTLAGNYMNTLGLPASASSSGAGFHTHTHGNMQTTYRTTPSPFDLTQTLQQGTQQQQPVYGSFSQSQQQQQYPQTAIPQARGGAFGAQSGFGPAGEDTQHLLSPSARALQAHAPGQSLPQGLAAGYSRIHALPSTLALSPPAGGEDGFGAGGDWAAQGQAAAQGTPGSVTGTGLESMFARLSYSAAATRGGTPATGATATAGAGTPPPPGLTRNVSSGRYGAGLLSPLSGPVMTKDDDDLFDMESG